MKERFDRFAEQRTKIDGIIADFVAGKPFQFEMQGVWYPIRSIKKDDDGTHEPKLLIWAMHETGDLEWERSLDDFLKMQKRAAEEEAAAQVRWQELEQMRHPFDASDRSTENKKLIFEKRYKDAVVEKLLNEFMNGTESPVPYSYNLLQGYLQTWAAGKDLEEMGEMYPGWTASDFIELHKIFESEEKRLRKEMFDRLKEQGVDATATRDLISRARAAEERLHHATLLMGRSYGMTPEMPSNPFHRRDAIS